MKKLGVVYVLTLVLIAVVAMPAGATSKEPVGAKISLFSGSPTFAAGAPFHISDGWQVSSNTDAVGKFDITLEVDGTLRKHDFVIREVTSGNPDLLARFWVFNFPSGLSGTHTFVGRFLGPCQPLVDFGYIAGPCSSPTTVTEALNRTLTVTFS